MRRITLVLAFGLGFGCSEDEEPKNQCMEERACILDSGCDDLAADADAFALCALDACGPDPACSEYSSGWQEKCWQRFDTAIGSARCKLGGAGDGQEEECAVTMDSCESFPDMGLPSH